MTTALGRKLAEGASAPAGWLLVPHALDPEALARVGGGLVAPIDPRADEMVEEWIANGSALSDAGRWEESLRAYEHAVREKYRFYSYGDCMLID